MNSQYIQALAFCAVTTEDIPFLFVLYASTRKEEMALTDWTQEQIDWFLNMQFDLQCKQWQQNYPHADFDLVLLEGKPVGRIFVNRQNSHIYLIDITF